MHNKDDLFQQYKSVFPNLSDEKVEEYASWMAEKYSTVKSGENVIHLDYYSGLITTSEIAYIEKSFKEFNLELSRFNKNGVPFASIEDFNLQLAIFLNESVVKSILLGIGTNALWDTIKKTAFLIWTKVKKRHWDKSAGNGRKTKLNFGLKVRLDENTGFDLKLDGDLNEELVLTALDKTIGLLKSAEKKNSLKNADFYIFNKQTAEWTKFDIMNEIHKNTNSKSK